MSCVLCENEFCVYEEKGKCTLSEISLDISGARSDCIYINIDEQTLKILKNATPK